MRAARRFASLKPDPEHVQVLALNHPAIAERRTIYPSTVVDAEKSPRLLVSGQNSRKLGAMVTKGKWRGFPIFQLTLEERATCPRTCFHWLSCYGNAQHRSRRHRHTGPFKLVLDRELGDLQAKHPRGFVVRLHVLGDFFSVAYVEAWRIWLRKYPALHVFGYTAWQVDTPIGAAIAGLRYLRWDRFAVRTSDGLTAPNAVTIWREPEANVVKEGIPCPAEMQTTECCGTCGLCWAAPDKTIVFVVHGPRRGATGRGDHKEIAVRNAGIIDAWNHDDRPSADLIATDFGLSRGAVARVIAAAQAAGTAQRRRA